MVPATPPRPRIRDVLAEVAGTAASGGMSDADYGALAAISGLPVLSGPLAGAALDMAEAVGRRLNLVARATATQAFAGEYGAILKAFVMALRGKNVRITVAVDTEHGAYVEATMTNDLFARGGTLQFTVVAAEPATTIAGTSAVAGQRFDYGKGSRTLTGVFAETQRFLTVLAG